MRVTRPVSVSNLGALLLMLLLTLPSLAQNLVLTAPPEVLDTSGQRGARIDPFAPELPNWVAPAHRDIPTFLDWRDIDGASYVSGVRNQGVCGSCWDFATIAMLESQAMIALHQPNTDPDFSEQYVLSCIGGGNDCDGGSGSDACDFLQTEGAPNEPCFEYEDDDSVPCSEACSDAPNQLHRVGEWWYVTTTTYDLDPIRNALQWGPLITWMRIHESFEFYQEGDIYSADGSPYTGENHLVLIVGYDDANQCWIAKNSWGTDWGDDGFFRIAYDNGCWFGLYTIAGSYEPPASGIELQLTVEDMQPSYTDYDLDVRVYDANDNLLTDVPFIVTTSVGHVHEQDPDTGGYGIGHAIIRTEEAGPAYISVQALSQVAVLRTNFTVGPPPALEPIGAVPPASGMETGGIAWSPDGQTLAVASYDGGDGLIQFVDPTTWAVTDHFTTETRACGLDFSPDGTQLVVAHSGKIAIYDPATGIQLDETEVIDGNPGDSRSTYWTETNRIITPQITSSDDQLCVLSSGLNLLTAFDVASFSSAGYSVAGDLIYFSSGTGPDEVWCYRLSNYSLRQRLVIPDPLSAAANPAGTRLAIARDNDDILVYNTGSWSVESTITGDFNDEMAFMEWSIDPATFGGIDQDSYVWFFHYDSGSDTGYPIGTHFIGGNGSDGMVAWHPQATVMAVSSPGIGVRFYAPRDVIDPFLNVEYPVDGAIVDEDHVEVSGTASDAAGMISVTVSNGDWSDEDHDLSDGFGFDVPLEVGDNTIVVRAVDSNYRSSVEERVVTLSLTSVPGDELPSVMEVYSPAPNPANPGTTIRYALPEPTTVSITVFDVSGRMVRRLVSDQQQDVGFHVQAWDGRDQNDRVLASGVYFVQVSAGMENKRIAVSLVK